LKLKRQSDINELLDDSKDLLSQIDNAYIQAKTNEDIIQVARPKIKSCLEHTRSSLDYIAKDLSEYTNSSKTPRNIYFPYGKDRKIFLESLNKNLPDLDHKYILLLESIQPHSCNDNWLLHLCKTTNFNKHTKLQEQQRQNSPQSITRLGNLVQMDSTSSVTFVNATVNGVLVNPNGPLVLTGDKPVADIVDELALPIPVERKYQWVKFILKGTDIDILELLQKSHHEINLLTERLYAI
jgi:hypothetical protein